MPPSTTTTSGSEGHSLSAQFQTSPQDTGEVRLYALSYTLPAPWAPDHQIALYGLRSDTNTSVFGQGLFVTGKGEIVGSRYVMPLPPYQTYAHNLTVGVDFKHFEQTTGFTQGEGLKTPVKYLPFLASYNSSLPDSWGAPGSRPASTWSSGGSSPRNRTSASTGTTPWGTIFMSPPEWRGTLPSRQGMGAFLKVDGQIADQPLIPNEQYTAGGMTSVRGYEEAAALGDDALHLTAEISGPDIGPRLSGRLQLTPYRFYDFARLTVISPLPSQTDTFRLQGAGVGLKGVYGKHWYYEVDYACPLSPMRETDKFEQRWYFKVGAQF